MISARQEVGSSEVRSAAAAPVNPHAHASAATLTTKSADGELGLPRVTGFEMSSADKSSAVPLDTLDIANAGRSAVAVLTPATWPLSAQHVQQQQQYPLLKPRSCPVPPSIVIPPPHPRFAVSNGSALALSPDMCFSASLLTTSPAGKPLSSAAASAELPEPGAASPASLAAMRDSMQFTSRFAMPTEAWTFEPPLPGAVGSSVFASLLHSPHFVDLGFQQQMTAAATAAIALPPHQHMGSPLLASPTESHMGFGVQPSSSPLQLTYPQMNPLAAASAHQQPDSAEVAPPPVLSSSAGVAPFSPTAEMHLSMFSLSDVLLLGGGGGGGEAGALMLSQSSPMSVRKPALAPSPSPPLSSSSHTGVGVKDITLNVLRPHFNKPMAVVAKELGVCITLMKKICRRNGLVRWPHRRIRSLVNRISSLQIAATSAPESEQTRLETQVAVLCDELSAVIQNPNEKSRKAQADAKARSPLAGTHSTASLASPRPMHDVAENEWVICAHSDSDATATAAVAVTDAQQSGAKCEPSEPSSDARVPTRGGAVEVKLEPQSRKRKRATPSAQQLCLPPPPIKIPRCRGVRARRNSAPEQQHLRALYDLPELERPSSTTSAHRKRGSISSILCDPAE